MRNAADSVMGRIDTKGLTLGSRQLAKLLVHRRLRELTPRRGPARSREPLSDRALEYMNEEALPTIRLLEYAHRRPPSEPDAASACVWGQLCCKAEVFGKGAAEGLAATANYFADVGTAHGIESAVDRAGNLVVQTLPAPYPISSWCLRELVAAMGIEERIDRKTYTALGLDIIAKGDVKEQAVNMIALNVFGRHRRYAYTPALQVPNDMQVGGSYAYLEPSVNEYTGIPEGVQTVIHDEPFPLHLVLGLGFEHIYTACIPAKAYQLAGALAYLQPGSDRGAAARRLADSYERLLCDLAEFYAREFGLLGPEDAGTVARFMGRGYQVAEGRDSLGKSRQYLTPLLITIADMFGSNTRITSQGVGSMWFYTVNAAKQSKLMAIVARYETEIFDLLYPCAPLRELVRRFVSVSRGGGYEYSPIGKERIVGVVRDLLGDATIQKLFAPNEDGGEAIAEAAGSIRLGQELAEATGLQADGGIEPLLGKARAALKAIGGS